ncbi:MAG: hypothetical protein AAGF12_06350 [Myxococcota bacterium]
MSACYTSHTKDECAEASSARCCSPDGRAVAPVSTCPLRCPPGSRIENGALCPGPDASIPDGGVPDADAAMPDGVVNPPICVPTPSRGAWTCRPEAHVAPGRPFELSVTIDACTCCPAASCTATFGSVLGNPTLQLTTELCDECDCLGCGGPFEVVCSVEALEEGVYPVVANSAYAFDLTVSGDLDDQPPACSTFASESLCSPSPFTANTSPFDPELTCVRRAEALEATRLELFSSCWRSGDIPGDCETEVRPRLTDDLPFGGDIFVVPKTHPSLCLVVDPGACTTNSMECVLPPLELDGFYRVFVGGRQVTSFTAGQPSEEVCTL